MNPKQLPLFIKRKGLYLFPYQWLGVFLTLVLFSLIILHEVYGYKSRDWILKVGIALILYLFGAMVYGLFIQKKAFGKFSGEIKFWKSKIQVGNVDFELAEVSKLEFLKFSDIEGRFIGTTNDLGPYLSNGLDNIFVLHLKNGEKISYNFLQTEILQLKNFKEILIHYHKMGVLGWLQLLDILEIKDYNAIQRFKKEINDHG